MKRTVAVLAFAVAACATAPVPTPSPLSEAPTPDGRRQVELLESFFMGTWATHPVGAPNPAAMRIRHAPIWKALAGEHWIYVEEVPIADELRPVRQRIYRLVEGGGRVYAVSYDLPGDPKGFVGEWRKPVPFERYQPRDLKERPGCRMLFVLQMGIIFAGGTEGERCQADAAHAAYERTEYQVTSTSMRTWTRPFDAGGRQVGGAPGPQEYRRIARMAQ